MVFFLLGVGVRAKRLFVLVFLSFTVSFYSVGATCPLRALAPSRIKPAIVSLAKRAGLSAWNHFVYRWNHMTPKEQDKVTDWFIKQLGSRYRIQTSGLDTLKKELAGKKGGVLFLFGDHWGYSDPMIQYSMLYKDFRLRPIMAEKQANVPIVKDLIKPVNPLLVADVGQLFGGGDVKDQIQQQVDEMADASAQSLQNGDDDGEHPQGELNRKGTGNFDGKSLVKRITDKYPGVHIVLVRMDRDPGQTVGHWGSSLGFGSTGAFPDKMVAGARLVDWLLTLGGRLMPKRDIHLTYKDVSKDFPVHGTVKEQNDYLRNFYEPPGSVAVNTYVPHRNYSILGIPVPWGEPRGNVLLPDPILPETEIKGDSTKVDPKIRKAVLDYLAEKSGVPADQIHDDTNIQGQLGLDSLSTAEINVWLEEGGGGAFKPVNNEVALTTPGQMMLVAEHGYGAGQGVKVRPPGYRWIRDIAKANGYDLNKTVDGRKSLFRSEVEAKPLDIRNKQFENSCQALLYQAKRHPDKVFIGDEETGDWSYREFMPIVKFFEKRYEHFKGKYVPILMPKTVVGRAQIWAARFAGKAPVNINFTSGPNAMMAGMKSLDLNRIVSAQAAVDKMNGMKMGENVIDLTPLMKNFWMLEDHLPFSKAKHDPNDPSDAPVTIGELLKSLIHRNLDPTMGLGKAPGAKAKSSDLDLVLFTSGSSGTPKAVGLTNENSLSNEKALIDMYGYRGPKDPYKDYRISNKSTLLIPLPDFHSFGSRLSDAAEKLGARSFLLPNPQDGAQMAYEVESKQVTHMALTPTFAKYMILAAKPHQLDTLRVVWLGAEATPPELVKLFKERAPNVVLLPAYGITETGPVVSANPIENVHIDSMGVPAPGVKTLIAKPDQVKAYREGKIDHIDPQPINRPGLLLVKSAGVMGGNYLNKPDAEPFVEYQGKHYDTTDVVHQDVDDHLYFDYRLARLVKIGGEMVSLPAAEDGYNEALAKDPKMANEIGYDSEAGVPFAVVPGPEKTNPPLYLVTSAQKLDMKRANQILASSGKVPGVARIRAVLHVEKLPVLGTGKTDYVTLNKMVQDPIALAKADYGPGGPGAIPMPVEEKPPTPEEQKALVAKYGRLPREYFGGKAVSMDELEDALTNGYYDDKGKEILPWIGPAGSYINGKFRPTEPLVVEAYQDAQGKRGLEVVTTVPMTLAEANARLRQGGYPPEITISKVKKVPFIPRSKDGRRPEHEKYFVPPSNG